MPELLGLLRQRLDQMRMRVARASYRDAGAEIEIFLAGLRISHTPLPCSKAQGSASIGVVKCSGIRHGGSPIVLS